MKSSGLTVVRRAHSVEIVADLDRRQLEMLKLELRRFARRYSLELRLDRVETGDEGRAEAGDRASAR